MPLCAARVAGMEPLSGPTTIRATTIEPGITAWPWSKSHSSELDTKSVDAGHFDLERRLLNRYRRRVARKAPEHAVYLLAAAGRPPAVRPDAPGAATWATRGLTGRVAGQLTSPSDQAQISPNAWGSRRDQVRC